MENGICEIKFLLLALSRFLSRKLVVANFGQRKGGTLPVARWEPRAGAKLNSQPHQSGQKHFLMEEETI